MWYNGGVGLVLSLHYWKSRMNGKKKERKIEWLQYQKTKTEQKESYLSM